MLPGCGVPSRPGHDGSDKPGLAATNPKLAFRVVSGDPVGALAPASSGITGDSGVPELRSDIDVPSRIRSRFQYFGWCVARGDGMSVDAQDIVVVEHVRDGELRRTILRRSAVGFVLDVNGVQRAVNGTSVELALAGCPEVTELRAAEETRITVAPTVLSPDALLEHVRFVSREPMIASEPDADDDDEGEEDDELPRWCQPTGTTVGGEAVAAVTPRGEERDIALWTRDVASPDGHWSVIAQHGWDSAQYAGVGNAGFGWDTLYAVRQGLFIEVREADEGEPDATVFRSSRPLREVVLDFMGDYSTEFLYEFGSLSSRTEGIDLEEPLPGTSIACSLPDDDIRWIVEQFVPSDDESKMRSLGMWRAPDGRAIRTTDFHEVQPSGSPAAVQHQAELRARWTAAGFGVAAYGYRGDPVYAGCVLATFGKEGAMIPDASPPQRCPERFSQPDLELLAVIPPPIAAKG